MTDDLADVVPVLRRARALLVDFDGPVCSAFGAVGAHHVASRLRRQLATREDVPPAVVAELVHERDPLAVFRAFSTAPEPLRQAVAAWLQDAEVDAVRLVQPTPHVVELLGALREAGLRVAIVSNNSTAAVSAFLDRTGLVDLVDAVAARTSDDPMLMKPSPFLLRQSADELRVPVHACAMYGDSITDITAAIYAGCPSIGFANRPEKVSRLSAAGADAVVTTHQTLVAALRQLLAAAG